jgi:hypothetical protein
VANETVEGMLIDSTGLHCAFSNRETTLVGLVIGVTGLFGVSPIPTEAGDQL